MADEVGQKFCEAKRTTVFFLSVLPTLNVSSWKFNIISCHGYNSGSWWHCFQEMCFRFCISAFVWVTEVLPWKMLKFVCCVVQLLLFFKKENGIVSMIKCIGIEPTKKIILVWSDKENSCSFLKCQSQRSIWNTNSETRMRSPCTKYLETFALLTAIQSMWMMRGQTSLLTFQEGQEKVSTMSQKLEKSLNL